ncbi:dTDP-4-dehydrorhamnose 3,5-epimerase [Octadecabacter ascidiaceicola]|uniref:dTDP-4-dehydrorhamnose 3,5-epimerase n=1 Tax=Octadecabacter ascidiaceicola TaxID=1655543 RepID=A0A238JQ15_9RHOB|nr:dTDP-4-dehydrorhamnose 3,5-epimerase [Octadecabacter ascidiaceicola]SMX32759.1 dTDP-4-dehydrorhamnose 3,5-epimerase [Octadecabacter ascidiaceicola]
MAVQIETTDLDGVLILTPDRFTDTRGFFSESYNQSALTDAGIETLFVQDNHSFSLNRNTVRGLHFQSPPYAQTKLVRCGRGACFDVAVDIRVGSPTFGKWVGVELSFENGRQLLVPAGFAHGFVTRVPETEVIYKCSNEYAPHAEHSLRWNDPSIGVDWGMLSSDVVLSDKDAQASFFVDLQSPFTWEVTA